MRGAITPETVNRCWLVRPLKLTSSPPPLRHFMRATTGCPPLLRHPIPITIATIIGKRDIIRLIHSHHRVSRYFRHASQTGTRRARSGTVLVRYPGIPDTGTIPVIFVRRWSFRQILPVRANRSLSRMKPQTYHPIPAKSMMRSTFGRRGDGVSVDSKNQSGLPQILTGRGAGARDPIGRASSAC